MENRYNNVLIGEITFTEDQITATDPCYGPEDGVSISIVPGTYACHALKDDDGMVFASRIVLDGCDDEAHDDLWESIDYIGVDAGLAGFFQNKPDFSDKEWRVFCEELMDTDRLNKGTSADSTYFFEDESEPSAKGFFTSSGYGDGEYEVLGIRDEGTGAFWALQICFD